jgi:hypothetical protein
MKSLLLLLSSVLLLASCSTAYRSGQTPDDVYFSPGRQKAEYVRASEDDNRRTREEEYYSYEDDRYLRYKVRNRSRWSYLDDYYRDPYAYRNRKYHYYDPYYWNGRAYWNYYYNPYGAHIIFTNPRATVYNRPRTYNLHVFDNPNTNSYNPKLPNSGSRQYNNPGDRSDNRSRNVGNDLRNIFGTERNSSTSKPSASSSENSTSKPSSGTVENAPKRSENSNGNQKSGSNTPARRY